MNAVCIIEILKFIKICSFHDPGDTEPDPDDSAGELSAELDVNEAGGAAVQDKRRSEGGRGAAASRQEGHTSTQDEVQCSTGVVSYHHPPPPPTSFPDRIPIISCVPVFSIQIRKISCLSEITTEKIQ